MNAEDNKYIPRNFLSQMNISLQAVAFIKTYVIEYKQWSYLLLL